MKAIWTGMLLVGIGAVGLSGCYVVSPYTYPPPAPAPIYLPPSARGTIPVPPPGAAAPAPPPGAAAPAPPPGGAATPPPAGGAPAPAPGTATNCQSVTVEGHYETRVAPSGQRET